MKINLEGTSNTRDLGGTATKYGAIAYGKLIRSGELSRLTEKDVATLKTLGLAKVIDLRTETEMEQAPDVKIDGVSYVANPIIEKNTYGITYENSSGEDISVMLAKGIERMKARGETPERHMEDLYTRFVTMPYSVKQYGKFLRLLCENAQGATLWHCTMGKDRVGTCTALLLTALGADRQAIVEDYMYTNVSNEGNVQAILQKVRPHVSEGVLEIVGDMLRVRESYLQTFFDKIEVYGGIDGFFAEMGITQAHKETLRRLYLQ